MNVITLLTPKAQVEYLYDDFTVRQGLEKLRLQGYTAMPVLNRKGLYVGSVTEGDFLRAVLEQGGSSLRGLEKLPLNSVIRPGFHPAVSVRVTLAELVEQAMGQSFIPVVDDRGAFVGIVTRQTILRKLIAPHLETEEPDTRLA